MGEEQKSTLVRDTSMVVMYVVGAGVLALILAKIIFGSSSDIDNSEVAVAERLAPVGTINIGEPFVLGSGSVAPADAPTPTVASTIPTAASAPAAPGKEAYGKICFACHDGGIGGAPKIGDAAAWAPRREKGTEMMVINVINGMTGETGIMPPKGGLATLSDDEVRDSVMYMLASLETAEASESAPASSTETPAADTPTAEPASEVAAAQPPGDGRGKEVYDTACFICHATGVAGAPKIGDVTDWAPRIRQGTEKLYLHSIKGFMGEAGLMPPKGGRMDFSDEEVNAAVDYMVTNSQ